MSNIICVIPARRGSKRLPLKNLKTIKGKPMLTYAIASALKSGLFDQVYVATEDAEIAGVAKRYGATVPELVPASLTGDFNPSWEPCLYLADRLNNKVDKFTDILCLQPNVPLIGAEDIVAGVEIFTGGDYDFLVSVAPIDPHYFHWAVVERAKGWQMYFGKDFLKDRSLLPPVFRPNGAIKLAKLERLREEKSFFGWKLGVHCMPEERSVYVVTASDLRIAEALMALPED